MRSELTDQVQQYFNDIRLRRGCGPVLNLHVPSRGLARLGYRLARRQDREGYRSRPHPRRQAVLTISDALQPTKPLWPTALVRRPRRLDGRLLMLPA
jgi:hypothetical protein